MLERRAGDRLPHARADAGCGAGPSRVLAAQLADERLELPCHLMRAALRPVRAVGQSGQATMPVTSDPLVHCPARHAETIGNLGHLPAVLNHRNDGLLTPV